ncbi:helix-turn-helix transcriptional regulator [Kaistia dalseonensis]|uniref:Transcriptional regulator with XRE-family HTH domain n=1 Tax=Kaistia dalseonensis TaxID=410840 RepID=A0ABU0H4G1_9HYPH|nr:helix-turn-helix transcriptional regulator [Kaistia dalseonensis]MCX5494336.1 helix-turn-helix transcriptional regulator [Kaistia dalseonensis]MDQ0436917.1 transcriptional regulator with XRE-family HTH domain [Kaistia dalseonensis]
MIAPTDKARREELGEFVRAHRERLQPSMFGIDPGARRRTPGLRREELAQLCGVSATWYSWIEQGRDVSVSATALGRLARVMRLSPAERAYLFDLAGKRDPQLSDEIAEADLPAGLIDALSLMATPAYLIDRSWTALAWNAPAERLFIGWLNGGETRNLLRYIFLDPHARALIQDWSERARRVAAEFRADYSRHIAAPEMRTLVDDLSRASPLFAEAWDAHAVVDREGGERTFTHPVDGFLRYRQITLLPARHPDLKLVILTPA